MVNLAQNVSLGFGVFDLVLLLDNRLVQHLHRVDLVLSSLLDLEYLSKTTLSNHLQNIKILHSNCRIAEFRIFVAIVIIISAVRAFRVERVVIAEIREVDFLNTLGRMLDFTNGETRYTFASTRMNSWKALTCCTYSFSMI